ncbi:nucleotidyltransferase family protein [soil metagenome]
MTPLSTGTPRATVAGLLLAAGAGRRFGGPKALVRTLGGEAWVVRGIRTLVAAGCSPVVVTIGAQAADVRSVIRTEIGDVSGIVVVDVPDWSDGLSASLRAGLAALGRGEDRPGGAGPHSGRHGEGLPVGVLITLVDLPGLAPSALERVRDAARDAGTRARGPMSAVAHLDEGPGRETQPDGAESAGALRGETPQAQTVRASRGRGAADALVQATYSGRPGHPVFIGRSHWEPLATGLTGDSGAREYLQSHGARQVECGDLWAGNDVDYPVDAGR